MKRFLLFSLVLLLAFIFVFGQPCAFAAEKIKAKLFYSLSCKHCIDIKKEYLPKVLSKYSDRLEIEQFNTGDPENFQSLLALEKRFNIKARVPAILIGEHFLVGVTQIESEFEPLIKSYIAGSFVPTIKIGKFDILNKFHTFSPLAIIAAGLIDGINPCAFTVLIFFISFLTLMGYKKRDLIVIGSTFILAVFLTYLAVGLGIFRGFYELKHFYLLLKGTYFGLAGLCFVMAYLNLRDFYIYKKTKSTESLKVKLPKPIRSRINAIISKYYRQGQKKGLVGLVISTLVVGFLVSLLEAICTGQVYLPTIVFILKEPSLRIRAIFFLLLYNFMFVVPLVLILALVVLGTTSKKLEDFFRKRIALIKILMFILFLGLGLFLVIGT